MATLQREEELLAGYQLTDERVGQFQMLYKKHFGKTLDDEDIKGKALRLIRLIATVYQPISKKQLNHVIERQQIVKKLPAYSTN